MIDGSFLTRDGLSLSTWRIEAPDSRPEPVLLIHGLGDHSRSLPYLRLGRLLAAQGFEVFAFDRRGSGRSAGRSNHASSWEELRDDLSRFVDMIEDRRGRLPSLAGLSFGGLQALDFALTAPESVHSCVVMAPALDVSGASAWLRRLLPLLAAWFPTLSVDPGLDETALTRDPDLCREYRADPLWRPRTTPALAALTLQTIDRVQQNASRFKTPLLVFHGAADRVVPIQGTRATFPHFGSVDKTFVEIPEAFHALPIEPGSDEMVERIATWLKARAGAAPRV